MSEESAEPPEIIRVEGVSKLYRRTLPGDRLRTLKSALVGRGVSENAAILAAQTGVTVFHVAFAHWVAQDDPAAFRRLIGESLEELRSVTAA